MKNSSETLVLAFVAWLMMPNIGHTEVRAVSRSRNNRSVEIVGKLKVTSLPTNSKFSAYEMHNGCPERFMQNQCKQKRGERICNAAAECTFCQKMQQNPCVLANNYQRHGCRTCILNTTNPYCKASIGVAPGIRKNITLSFQIYEQIESVNKLDFYYLLDFSHSTRFNRLREQMVSYGNELSKMYPLADLAMGLGSFVDKELKESRNWETPDFYSPQYFPGHSYQNWFNLSTNIADFNKVLGNVSQRLKHYGAGGTNQYFLESQLEALTQVALCPLGWREGSKKIVVMVTDSGFHSAEEDVENQNIGGKFPAFDGKCHLTHTGSYSMALKLKYPGEMQTIEFLRGRNIGLLVAFYRWDKVDDPDYFSWANDFKRDTDQYRELVTKFGPSSRLWIFNSSKPRELKSELDQLINSAKESGQPEGLETNVIYEIRVTGDVNDLEIYYFSNCGGIGNSNTTRCQLKNYVGTLDFTIEFYMPYCITDEHRKPKVLTFSLKGLMYKATVVFTPLYLLPSMAIDFSS